MIDALLFLTLSLITLSLKCKIHAIWLVETVCIFMISLIATVKMECEKQEARRDMQKIWIYTNLIHIWYMCKYRVKHHLIVLKLDSVSTNKILITKLVTVKVSQNLNLIQSLSTQWNQQLIRYVFSKAIERLEQNIRKQIDWKRPSNTKQLNWVQNIQIEITKYKAVECFKI